MEKLEKFGGQTSLGRSGQPAELASIYDQLASEAASYATGQVYGSSGGTGQPKFAIGWEQGSFLQDLALGRAG